MKHASAKQPAHHYWEQAGRQGYLRAMYRDAEVADYLRGRLWETAVAISNALKIKPDGHVLDLGCGDGDFANCVLARHFAKVDGLDGSQAAIQRARTNAPRAGIGFNTCDITHLDFSKLPRYDAVFLMGILHHVKAATPALVRGLRAVTDRVIVLEPNGNHLLRKLLERTSTYRAAGEDSFRTRQLEEIFATAGYARALWQRLNLLPNFTPRLVFKALRPLEHFIETTPGLRALCTVNSWGFVAANPVATRAEGK